MTKVAALVLAAGRGSRFGAAPGESKAAALLDGLPLVRRVAITALASKAAPVIVVTGHAGSAVADALAGLDVRLIENGDHASGLSASLKVGLSALPREVDGALVLLADMPIVTTATLDTLIAALAAKRPQAVAPCHRGRRGNPVLIAREVFAEVAALDGDQGAGALLAGWRVVCCEVDDPGIFVDVDTPATLRDLSEPP